MKDKIFEVINRKGAVTFIELCDEVEGFRGDSVIGTAKNVIYWSGVSEEAITHISDLLKENKIKFTPANPLTYLMDGCSLSLPLVKKDVHYKTPHWLPVVMNVVTQLP